MGYQIVTPFAVNKKNGDNNGYIKKDVIKMTAPRLKHKEDTKPQITYTETPHKASKRLSDRLCGIALIALGMLSAKLTGDGTAAVMLLVMGLTAVFGKD